MRQLLHLSDVHFGPKHLPEVAAGVLRLAAERRPDLVVISGDLTQRAKPYQFREARQFSDRLSLPVLAVPGNHDVPLYRVWERVFLPYGAYRRHYQRNLEPTFEDAELLVVGLNTAYNWTFKGGRLTRSQLGRLERRLDAAKPEQARIVVAHHHMVSPEHFDRQRVIHGARRAARAFSRLGVEMVLSGHQHQTFLGSSRAFFPDLEPAFLLAHTGTSTSSRGRGREEHANTCNWVVVGPERIEVAVLGWQGREFVELERQAWPRWARPVVR